MKIVAFGASYSTNSINKKLAAYTVSRLGYAGAEILDLNDYELPLFTTDLERRIGHPQPARNFVSKLEEADLLVISLAEHNGSYSAGFKNLFDWASRIKIKMFEGKKVLLLATAPGPRGGLSVLEAAKLRFPVHGAEIAGAFSLPKFAENFSDEEGITNEELKEQFEGVIGSLLKETVPGVA